MEEKLKNITTGQALIAGLVLAGLYFFMFYDDGSILETNIASIRSDIQKGQTEMEDVRKAIEDAERYQKTKAALGVEMDNILLAIPIKLNSTDLMKTMSNEAKSVGAEIISLSAPQSFRAEPGDANTVYEPILISVELSGTYNQLMLFLSNLTRLNKIITSTKLQLSLKSSSGPVRPGTPPTLSMNASFQAYKYNPPADAGAAAGGTTSSGGDD
jgi:Tfp pilus assembly protein PilO